MSVSLKIRACDFADHPTDPAGDLPNPVAEISNPGPRPFVAVGTTEGVLVDKHIGEISVFQIWKPTEEGYLHLDDRLLPESGAGLEKWLALANALKDCRALLVSGIGELPAEVLAGNSLSVIEMNGFITMGLDAVYFGREIALLRGRRRECRVGGRCSGRGRGCRKSKMP
jgi:nitrogen fixation protein NifB